MNIAEMRREYILHQLNEEDTFNDPILQFNKWFTEAMDAQVYEPNAMTLATADASGKPAARVVLLKGFDESGLYFYTNYMSRKGEELAANPRAALVFFWHELERQVRVEGTVEKVPREVSEKYFHSRPYKSQISATISPQSREIHSKKMLEEEMEILESTLAGKEVPLPDAWGGYLIRPHLFEFWQGRQSRFHDRIQYSFDGGIWTRVRLAP